MPREMIQSYVAPRYYPHIGPILVRWEDYEYGSLRLVIGSHAYSKTRATFLSQVVCRDVVGALVLLMNLQLESHANRVNATTDSSMFHIKSSTTNQGIHTNSFLRVNKAFCQFALDFISMLLVYNAWSPMKIMVAECGKEHCLQCSSGCKNWCQEVLVPLNLRQVLNCYCYTGGLSLYVRDGRVHLASIAPSTPAARIHSWRTRIRGAWLIKVDGVIVESIDDVVRVFDGLRTTGSQSVTLLFSHPKVRPNLSQDGLPILSSASFTQHTHDQLNNRWEFSTVAEHLSTCRPSYEHVRSGDVLNVVTRVMRLTRGKLLKQPSLFLEG